MWRRTGCAAGRGAGGARRRPGDDDIYGLPARAPRPPPARGGGVPDSLLLGPSVRWAPRRSTSTSCPARCWRGRWGGRTASAPPWCCGARRWSGSAASRPWWTTWRTTTCWAGWSSARAAVALADTIPATTVAETTLGALWRHELRWARTIRALVPVPFAASVLQYPLAWAALAVLLGVAPPGRWAGSLPPGSSAPSPPAASNGAGPCQPHPALASAAARAYVGGRDGRELCRPPRRLARPHTRS